MKDIIYFQRDRNLLHSSSEVETASFNHIFSASRLSFLFIKRLSLTSWVITQHLPFPARQQYYWA